MLDVSAAIVLLAGAVFAVAGVLPSPLTDSSRQKFVGTGLLLALVGFVAWAVAFVATVARS